MQEKNSTETMRLDRFLGVTGCCSRTDAKKIIRSGGVAVNGRAVRNPEEKIFPETDEIFFAGKRIQYRKYTYIMLNKPEGYVSATEDGREKTVLDLLPDDMNKSKLFPCGRLDKNTLGLMLITDNGELSHRLLAPASHVSKSYGFRSKKEVSETEVEMFENGLTLEDGYVTKPARIELYDDRMSGTVYLIEGKYHQIKRMFEAMDNKIVYLERLTFGPLTLDTELERGQWRYLTDEEIRLLIEAGEKKNENNHI